MHQPTVPDLSLKIIDAGRLQLLHVLGAGAYGTIYRALDRTNTTSRPMFLAVKVLPLADRRSRRGIYQAREIGYHNYVSGHPNIVKLHRVVRDTQYMYIVLDYCPGGDMYKIISQTRNLARNDALIKNTFLQLIDAVDACHQNGIFHRDLKPENILVGADATQLYLGDFGLATRTSQSSNFGTGSSYYMSPECINANSDHEFYDPRRGDIWALGVILTNMVTGRCPWKRAVPDDVCYAHYLHDASFLRQMLPISKGVDVILRSIFVPCSSDCIDLITLRQLVLDIDTFYMTTEELETASEHVREAWKSYRPPSMGGLEGSTLVEDESESIMESASSESGTNSLEDDSDDSNEHSRGIGSQSLHNGEEAKAAGVPSSTLQSNDAAMINVGSFRFRIPASIQAIFTLGSTESSMDSEGPRAEESNTPSDASSSSSQYDTDSSSDEDSDGPITPETHAQDPAVVVPEFSDGEGLGIAVETVDLVGKKPRARTASRLLRSLFGRRRGRLERVSVA